MFLDLPPEILTHILLSLPFTSVVICQGVNRHLQVLISESTVLQYYVHLGIYGLMDNPCCDLSVYERLSQLLVKEYRWEELNFDFDKIVKVPLGLNIYAKLSMGFFYGVGVHGRFCSMQIPTVPDREVKWQEVCSERKIISSGVCADEYDLQVLITAQLCTRYTNAAESRAVYEVQLHLNQLSTGEPHPGAQQTTISFDTYEGFENPCAEMVCSGDNLIFILMDPDSRNQPNDQVYVYEWRTGQPKLRLSALFHSYHYPLSLTTDILLLSNQNTGELEYWRIPQNPSEPTPNQPFFILASPQLRSGNTFTYLRCRAEPNPGVRFRDVSKPFYTAPQHAIVVFCVGIQSSRFAGFMLFVHRSSLVGCLDKFSSFTSFTDRPRPVPYNEWGPPVCRWINGERSWIEITFGQRFIAPPPERAIGRKPITLLDFNPIDVARVSAAEKYRLKMKTLDNSSRNVARNRANKCLDGSLSEGTARGEPELKEKDKTAPTQIRGANILGVPSSPFVEETTTFKLPRRLEFYARAVIQPMNPLNDPYGCFEDTVYSSLPYTVRLSQEKYSFSALVLDEESILGIKEDEEERIEELHILHYG